ncbi:MAG: DNA/RNA non-specific endonuclease [Planctomycetes bacterium]|nr:DNA/RNA non-specific endonuclease [Planctomycetota bacterium]
MIGYLSGFEAGTLSRFTSASSSRNLFGGYRYESPLAGVRDDLWMAVQGRQSGKNFTGLHYTLHRHYDPYLMRFTSIDPAAAPFFNLYSYTGNNPSRYFDPDGLERMSKEDEEYFAEVSARSKWLGDALNFFDYFEGGKRGEFARQTFGIKVYDTVTLGKGVSDQEWEALEYQAGLAGEDAKRGFKAGKNGGATAEVVLDVATDFVPGVNVAKWSGQAMIALAEDDPLTAVVNISLLATRVKMPGSLRREAGKRTAREAERLIAKAGGDPKCFVAGTQVAVQGEDGKLDYKNIEEIKTGDQVWSRNEVTGEEGFKPVVRLFVNQTTSLVHLSYRRETRSADGDSEGGEAGDGDEPEASTLTGTPEHPFWSVTRQAFVGMGTLKPGERLLLADGSAATVTASRIEQLAKPVTVYNFEVADWHTYFVAADRQSKPVWVHNLCALKSTYDELGRLSKVRAKITRADIGAGTSTNLASRTFARSIGNQNDDAGHLIARLLGGPGGKNSGNIVPQLSSVNRGSFARFERMIADEVESGKTAYLRVRPVYDGTSTRPSSIIYDVRINGQRWKSRVFSNIR